MGGSFGMFEMVLIFLVVLLVFGAKRIPEIARGIGQGIREFKNATSQITDEINRDEDPKQRINRPKQGQSAPRKDQQAPPEPARADNPGNQQEEENPQQS